METEFDRDRDPQYAREMNDRDRERDRTWGRDDRDRYIEQQRDGWNHGRGRNYTRGDRESEQHYRGNDRDRRSGYHRGRDRERAADEGNWRQKPNDSRSFEGRSGGQERWE